MLYDYQNSHVHVSPCILQQHVDNKNDHEQLIVCSQSGV